MFDSDFLFPSMRVSLTEKYIIPYWGGSYENYQNLMKIMFEIILLGPAVSYYGIFEERSLVIIPKKS